MKNLAREFIYRLRVIVRPWATIPAVSWITVFCPTMLGLLLLVSLGPYIQDSLLSAASAGAPNLYDAQFKGGIARQPNFEEALKAAFFTPQLIAIAAVTAIAAVVQRSVRGFFLATSLSVLAAWSFFDFFTLENIVDNIAMNLCGGLVAGAVMALALCIARDVSAPFTTPLARRLCMASTITLVPAIAFGAVLAGLNLFYDAPPVEVDLTTSPPVEGFIVASRTTNKSDDQFDFLPDSFSGSIVLQAFRGTPWISYQTSPHAQPRDVTIGIHADCFAAMSPKGFNPRSSVVIGRVSALRVSLDSGPAIIRSENMNAVVRSKFDWGTFYWVKETEGEKIEVEYFTSEKDKLDVRTAQDIELDLTASMHNVAGERIARTPRNLSITRDGRTQTITFVPGGRGRADARLNCRRLDLDALTLGKIQAGQDVVINVGTAGLGGARILLANREQEERDEGATLVDDAFVVSGFAGSSHLVDIPLDKLTRLDSGGLGGLTVRGGTSALLVNREKIDIDPRDTTTFLGGVSARYLEGGSIWITGTADAAWRNNIRLNETRWERLPSEWKLALIGFIFTAISGVILFAWRRVRPQLAADPRTWT